jgi:nucleotide-binding universal stress UspA family protein
MTWPAGTSVVVVSAVRTVTPIYSEVYAPAIDQTGEIMKEQIKFHQELVSDAEKKLRLAGLKTEARVLEGDPREALVEAAKLERADLLVVGFSWTNRHGEAADG